MQCNEIEYLAREEIGQPDPLNSRYTPGTMLDFINRSIYKVAMDTNDLRGEYDYLSQPEQDEIVLPEGTIQVHWVTFDGTKLQRRDVVYLDDMFPTWRKQLSSTPKYYYHRRVQAKLTSIGVFPKIKTKDLVMRVGASVIPPLIVDPSAEPAIREAYHMLIVPLVVLRCAVDMGDATLAATAKTEYDAMLSKIVKLSQEADDDGPLSITPGNPIREPSNQADIRFWL